MNPNARSFNPAAASYSPVSSIVAPTPPCTPQTSNPILDAGGWESRFDGGFNSIEDNFKALELQREAEQASFEEHARTDANLPEYVAPKEVPIEKKPEPVQETKEPEAEEEPEEDDVEEERGEHVHIFFMGHVDAGKSTICGNLLFLTGMVDKRTIEKYEIQAKEQNRGSWYLAYIMDTSDEERAKGKTVEVGKAYFETPKKRYTILDAPGHKAYVPNMIQGAVQADLGVMVISAKTGEFESGFEKSGQTREHMLLAKTLGIRKVVVAVNKMDEVGWDKQRYDEIVTKISQFVRQEKLYNPKTDINFLPISGYTGANLTKNDGSCDWYKEKSLVEILDELPPMSDTSVTQLRLPIADKFKDMGIVSVSGKLIGTIRKNQKILVMPNKTPGSVTGIFIRTKEEEEKEVKRATNGESVRVTLSGVDDNLLSNGMVLCSPSNPVPITKRFKALIQVKDLAGSLFCAGYKAVLHVHNACVECTVEELISELDPATRQVKKRRPVFVKVGSQLMVLISTSGPVCIEEFQNFPVLGRFTFRDQGKTIAIGRVETVLQDK